jgi:hypothetical protein
MPRPDEDRTKRMMLLGWAAVVTLSLVVLVDEAEAFMTDTTCEGRCDRLVPSGGCELARAAGTGSTNCGRYVACMARCVEGVPTKAATIDDGLTEATRCYRVTISMHCYPSCSFLGWPCVGTTHDRSSTKEGLGWYCSEYNNVGGPVCRIGGKSDWTVGDTLYQTGNYAGVCSCRCVREVSPRPTSQCGYDN